MKTMAMLIRREFWEHRMIVIAPAVLSAIYLGLCVLAGTKFKFTWFDIEGFSGGDDLLPPMFYLVMNTMFAVLLYMLMGIVSFFYLCDCLYAERKDRSILFWKSLPVSDSMTVLSKLIVGLIGVPLVAYVFALVTNVLAFVVFKVAFESRPPILGSENWTVLTWLQLNGFLLLDVFILALWFAPVAAYQMLVSVSVPRAALVWAVLPPIALMLGQWILFGSWSIAELIGLRLGGVVGMLNRGGPGGGVDNALHVVNGLPLLARADLWIGVALAAAMIFATIHIRRHRADG